MTPQEPGRERAVYVASKTKHAQMWRDLREAGAPIISTWIDEAGPGESKSRVDLWRRCVSEASRATALILFATDGQMLEGALVEVGVVLGQGRPVILLGDHARWTFEDHPLVTRVETIDEALRAALAVPAPPPKCEHVRTSPEGTSYCTLAEQGSYSAAHAHIVDYAAWIGPLLVEVGLVNASSDPRVVELADLVTAALSMRSPTVGRDDVERSEPAT